MNENKRWTTRERERGEVNTVTELVTPQQLYDEIKTFKIIEFFSKSARTAINILSQ